MSVVKCFLGPALMTCAAVFCPGCADSSANVNLPPVPARQDEQQQLVVNPAYASWSKFAVGTRIVRRKTISNSEGSHTVTTTLKLVDLDENQAVVESQTKVDRAAGSVDNPPQTFRYAAMFSLPAGKSADDFALPSPGAKLIGTEELEVLGRAYQVKVYQWEGTLESGRILLKAWSSDDFPGNQIRVETDYLDSAGSRALEEIIEMDISGHQSKVDT